MSDYKSLSGSAAENLFIELFSETFGAEKAGLLYSQYPFMTFIKTPDMPISYVRAATKRLP